MEGRRKRERVCKIDVLHLLHTFGLQQGYIRCCGIRKGLIVSVAQHLVAWWTY